MPVAGGLAIDKQLGLKPEQVPIPQTVLVVGNVERSPAANAPEVKDVLSLIKSPTEFEVADVNPNSNRLAIVPSRIDSVWVSIPAKCRVDSP